jgi:hypothetical protein
MQLHFLVVVGKEFWLWLWCEATILLSYQRLAQGDAAAAAGRRQCPGGVPFRL